MAGGGGGVKLLFGPPFHLFLASLLYFSCLLKFKIRCCLRLTLLYVCLLFRVVELFAGIIQRVIDGLTQDQQTRSEVDPEGFLKVSQFITRLVDLKEDETGFEIIMDDPSGNSFVENPFAPNKDERGSVSHYIRY